MKVKEEPVGSGIYVFYCVGCACHHHVHTFTKNSSGAIWAYNGDAKKPTFTPSLHIWSENKKGTRHTSCHSVVTDGMIKYGDDCAHGYAGTTIEIPEI
jgi:hypothetical protein